MDTPIYDFLQAYAATGMLKAHMPGHKGKAPVKELKGLYELDITEIKGADSLFEAEGIIAKSEKNTAKLNAELVGELSALGNKLEGGGHHDALTLFAEYPDVFESGNISIVESHFISLLPLLVSVRQHFLNGLYLCLINCCRSS